MQTKPKCRALFLDRDGTINIDKGYVYQIKDLEFQPGIFDLVKKYAQKGYLIFIVTNQSGIARGLYTEKDYLQLTNEIAAAFLKRGITIEKVYHCPHHPEITGTCLCRKPAPGMIIEAIQEYHIDPAASVLIGDSERDLLAGKRAGIGKNLYIQDLLTNGTF